MEQSETAAHTCRGRYDQSQRRKRVHMHGCDCGRSYLQDTRGIGGQERSCLNWCVLSTSPLKLASHTREPGRAQYRRGGVPAGEPRGGGKKQAPYSPSRSLFPTFQNFSLHRKKSHSLTVLRMSGLDKSTEHFMLFFKYFLQYIAVLLETHTVLECVYPFAAYFLVQAELAPPRTPMP